LNNMKMSRLKWAIGSLVAVFVLSLGFFNFATPPVVYAAPACTDINSDTGSIEYQMCDEGLKNAGTTDYCERYSGAAAYDACKYGYQIGNNQTPSSPPATSTAACDSKYGQNGTDPDNNALTMCNEGASNASNATYCDKYQGTAAETACRYGHTAANGGSSAPSNQDLYNSSGMAGWCDSRFTDANDRQTCKEGAINMGVNDYCERYAGTAAYNACKAGWDEARSKNAGLYTETTGGGTSTGDTTCAIPYVGWAICPILLFASQGIDQMYNVLTGFLETPVSIFTESETNGVKSVYQQILTIANVVLAIIFLIIIYAEATGGVLLSNYTVKKLMPKLVVAAIFVNLAFYICAVMVDLTNIVGQSIPGFFTNMAPTPGELAIPFPDSATGEASWAGLTGSILAGGAVAGGIWAISGATFPMIGWAVVLFLIPLILGVLLAILAILLALTLRSVMIIMFVIISPLAFCAMILPNTEKLFKKWWDIFWKMLLLFPIVAFVFGGSRLAGSIIMSIDRQNIFLLIAGSAATILPLILVPKLLKGAVSMFGSLGKQVEGIADKSFSKGRTATDKRMKESSVGEYMTAQGTTQRSMRKSGVKRSKIREALRENSYKQNRVMAGAGALADLDAKNLKGMSSYLSDFRKEDGQGLDNADYMDIIMGRRTKVGNVPVSDTMLAAAFAQMKTAGGAGQKQDLFNYVASRGTGLSQGVRRAAFDALNDPEKVPQLQGIHIANMLAGRLSASQATRDFIENNLSAEGLTNMKTPTLKEIGRFSVDNGIDFRRFHALRSQIYATPELNAKVDSAKRAMLDGIDDPRTYLP
jgi:hypothetical protein